MMLYVHLSCSVFESYVCISPGFKGFLSVCVSPVFFAVGGELRLYLA